MASKEQVGIVEEQPLEGGEKLSETCRELLLTFWREGWFGASKKLSEVHNEMDRRGYHFDRTAVSHALVDLVREDTLSREGAPRNYRYVQKRPPSKGHGSAATA